MYYSYCAVDHDIQFHDTLDEARARAEQSADWLRDDAAESDWVWNDNGPDSSYGKVIGKVSYNDRELGEEERADNPNWDSIRSCNLEEVDSPSSTIVHGDEALAWLDDALIASCLGTIESFKTPTEALQALVSYEVKVATDPKVNGGKVLVDHKEFKHSERLMQDVAEAVWECDVDGDFDNIWPKLEARCGITPKEQGTNE